MRPSSSDHPAFAETYIGRVPETDPLGVLLESAAELSRQLSAIPPDASGLSYGPGKWTVRQVLRHVIDTERIFAYRVLCIARGDTTPLPPFDEQAYAEAADEALADLDGLIDEFNLVRRSTIALFGAFPASLWGRYGTAGGGRVSVNALAYMIIGHWRHHAALLTERYGLVLS